MNMVRLDILRLGIIIHSVRLDIFNKVSIHYIKYVCIIYSLHSWPQLL